ncbi:TPA: hypothetical protein P9G65_005549 [Pseudomonas aeruginosa]|nr:hypothetical protein [Pseudomonas aeruginosa]HDQ4723261.1 hypothetical protein [Pseudomonas aeruginosa]
MNQDGIKGCPACHRQPVVSVFSGGPSDLIHAVECQAAGCGKAMVRGHSFNEVVAEWNDDASWLRIGVDERRVQTRPLYPMDPER